MSRHATDLALGKLTMDAWFRDALFRDPMATSRVAGMQLTDQERGTLGRIRPGALAAFQRYLDGKRVGDCRGRQAHDVEDSYDTSLTRSAS
jgi:hypothetical protein